MAKLAKKYKAAIDQVDREREYGLVEAIQLVKEIAPATFDETVEVAVRLGVDTKSSDQQIRGVIVLPNGTGKTQRVLVFAKGEKATEAEKAGADYIGDEDMINKVSQGWLDFDVVVATPDMMAQVGKLGRILGPKGLMPNPKTGTVTFEVEQAVNDIKAGQVEYRADKAGNVHVPIGKVSFTEEQLTENLETLLDTLVKARPAATKGQFLRKVTVSSTMGPGVQVDTASLEK